jgi:cytoskeleton protein RodZ
MAPKSARSKLRLTEIETLSEAGRSRRREPEFGSQDHGGQAPEEPANQPGDRTAAAEPTMGVREGGTMSYRDSVSRASTVGDDLARARAAAGLELDDVAAQLRIRREFLAALEDGRTDALPGVTYAIGYVRTYAAFLGLDVERAVTRFKQEAAGLDQRTELVFPSPAPEGRVPGLGLMFASVLLAGIAYGGWYVMSERGLSIHDMVPEVPERLANLIEGGATPSPSGSPPAVPAGDASGDPATAAATQAPEASRPGVVDYRTANPSGVPVTARTSEDGVADATERAEIADAPLAEPESASTTDRVESAPAPTRAAAPAPVDPAPAAPARTADADTSGSAVTASEATAAEARAAETSAAETSVAETSVAETPLASAAAADDPPTTDVPSAPRLSGLIGASEAAVPSGDGADAVPAAIERIIVRATGESWVQVRAEDGTTLFTRVLRDGDVYRVPDRSGLTLATGNAGALEVVVDGQPAPSLGSFGEVVRNIVLDPARLAAGTAIGRSN